jgi:ubiquinone/menaquinone biosynthesis C-methylase UbiE
MKQNPFDNLTSEYEAWFVKNKTLFQSELLALRQVVPVDKKGLEIGVGSGIFAEQLGIHYGIDPAEKMLEYARFYAADEIVVLLETNSFRVVHVLQTLENPATTIVEDPAEGHGKGSFVVIKGVKE